jgi:hypothetical protein
MDLQAKKKTCQKKQLPDFSIDIFIGEYNISPKKKDFLQFHQ